MTEWVVDRLVTDTLPNRQKHWPCAGSSLLIDFHGKSPSLDFRTPPTHGVRVHGCPTPFTIETRVETDEGFHPKRCRWRKESHTFRVRYRSFYSTDQKCHRSFWSTHRSRKGAQFKILRRTLLPPTLKMGGTRVHRSCTYPRRRDWRLQMNSYSLNVFEVRNKEKKLCTSSVELLNHFCVNGLWLRFPRRQGSCQTV